MQPAGVESGPEIECIPYGAWNKSFRQVAAQLTAAQVFGSTHLNISLCSSTFISATGSQPQTCRQERQLAARTARCAFGA